MTEHGVVFYPEMVRAALSGRKTETRRLVSSQPELVDGALRWRIGRAKWFARSTESAMREEMAAVAPYKIGDRLWIREKHAYLDVVKSAMSQFPLGPENGNALGPDVWNLKVEYSDGSIDGRSVEGEKPTQTRELGGWAWRSARFMHKWAARPARFEITAVRAERLQEITETGALAEGVDNVAAYRELWDNLHKATGHVWGLNPWLYVYTFRRV
jgi:hypothetical protein